MTAARAVPRLRDRASQDRHFDAVSADHNGKYLAKWMTDLKEAEGIAVYLRFFGINQSENHHAISGTQGTRSCCLATPTVNGSLALQAE